MGLWRRAESRGASWSGPRVTAVSLCFVGVAQLSLGRPQPVPFPWLSSRCPSGMSSSSFDACRRTIRATCERRGAPGLALPPSFTRVLDRPHRGPAALSASSVSTAGLVFVFSHADASVSTRDFTVRQHAHRGGRRLATAGCGLRTRRCALMGRLIRFSVPTAFSVWSTGDELLGMDGGRYLKLDDFKDQDDDFLSPKKTLRDFEGGVGTT